MSRDMRVLQVFIASPGGVSDERNVAESAINRINTNLAKLHNVFLAVTRYEQIVGAAGNPQSQINQHADNADIFIGIVHRRWGSDTGNGFASGFHEEFTRALQRWQSSGTPRLALFFKTVDPDSLADPGEQLLKVIEFKNSIEANHTAFYNQFSATAELEGLITTLIAEELANHASMQMSQTSDGQGAVALVASTQTPTVNQEPISNELANIVDAFATVLGGGDTEVRLDPDRFELFALAVSRNRDKVPVHLANRLYARHGQLSLIGVEQMIWFREYLRDIGRNLSIENRVIPFPDVVGKGWIAKVLEEEIEELVQSDDSSVVNGTIRLLRELNVRPKALWNSSLESESAAERQEIWRSMTTSTSKIEVVHYWLAVHGDDDLELAKLLADGDDVLGEVGRAFTDLMGDDPTVANVVKLDAKLLIDPLVRKQFVGGFPERTLANDVLASFVVRSFYPGELRIVALTELIRKDEVNEAVINAVFDSSSSNDWGRMVNKVLREQAIGQEFAKGMLSFARSLEGDEGKSSKLSRAKDLIAMSIGQCDEISDMLSRFLNLDREFDLELLRLKFLGSYGDSEFEELALSIIKNEHQEFRNYISQLESSGWNERTKKFVLERAEIAALSYLDSLCENSDPSTVLKRIREIAHDDESLWQNEALRLLVPNAGDKDVDVMIANSYALDPREESLAVVLGGATLKRLRAFVSGEDYLLASLALVELEKRDRLPSIAQLKKLLRSPSDKVRIVAIERLDNLLDLSELKDLANEYIQGKGTHYYNVLCYIDCRLAQMPKI